MYISCNLCHHFPSLIPASAAYTFHLFLFFPLHYFLFLFVALSLGTVIWNTITESLCASFYLLSWQVWFWVIISSYHCHNGPLSVLIILPHDLWQSSCLFSIVFEYYSHTIYILFTYYLYIFIFIYILQISAVILFMDCMDLSLWIILLTLNYSVHSYISKFRDFIFTNRFGIFHWVDVP